MKLKKILAGILTGVSVFTAATVPATAISQVTVYASSVRNRMSDYYLMADGYGDDGPYSSLGYAILELQDGKVSASKVNSYRKDLKNAWNRRFKENMTRPEKFALEDWRMFVDEYNALNKECARSNKTLINTSLRKALYKDYRFIGITAKKNHTASKACASFRGSKAGKTLAKYISKAALNTKSDNGERNREKLAAITAASTKYVLNGRKYVKSRKTEGTRVAAAKKLMKELDSITVWSASQGSEVNSIVNSIVQKEKSLLRYKPDKYSYSGLV